MKENYVFNDLLYSYVEYINSYATSYFELRQSKNKQNLFYPLGLVFTNYMELWIKFCIVVFCNDIGTIKELGIGTHSIIELLSNEMTIFEFKNYGIRISTINSLNKKVKQFSDILKTDDWSFAFRYPTDKNNNFYTILNNKDKKALISLMNKIFNQSYLIFLNFYKGLIKNTKKQSDILQKFLNKYSI